MKKIFSEFLLPIRSYATLGMSRRGIDKRTSDLGGSVRDYHMENVTMAETKSTATMFGPGNLKITEGENKVTIEFDPSRVIGKFESGRPQCCSTGDYRTLTLAGVKVMLHVIGRP